MKQRLAGAREETQGTILAHPEPVATKPPSPGDGLCGAFASDCRRWSGLMPGGQMEECAMGPGNDERPKDEELVAVAHELNRHLFEGNGDAFAVALADHIRHRKIVLSKEALDFLIEAISSVRRR